MEEKKDVKNTTQQPDVAEKTKTSVEDGDKKVAPKTEGEKSTRPQDKKKGFFRRGGGSGRQGKPGGRRQVKGRGHRGERVKPEFDQKIINIRRVTRVMAGGRRFSFSVALVAGNRNGKVGVGVGKATDTALAIEKAFKNAKKNMVEIKRTKDKSIAHEVNARYCTSEVYIKPAKGKGVVAGSSARNVLGLAGITDVSSKVLSRSKNKINIARATITALGDLVD